MLELADVGFAYDRERWVFRHVDLTVAPGTVTAVLGPNGRGKTTLVRCAAGLLKPTEGEVRRRGDVGFVAQSRGSSFAYSALDMVIMGRVREVSLFAGPSRSDRIAALDAMERTGVAELYDRPFPTLSGGEQQLVLIARALVSDCPTLVLDEPSTGLDLRNQAQILSLLRKFVADGMAVLLTTHHPDQALFLADSVVLMRSPQDVSSGPAQTLLTDAALTQLYGIEVRTVTYRQHGQQMRAIITKYGEHES
jgi:iron complex transport system ATP-binding protein